MIQFNGWETIDLIIDFLIKIKWPSNDTFYQIVSTNNLDNMKSFLSEFIKLEQVQLNDGKAGDGCILIEYGSFKICLVDISKFKINSNDTITV